MRLLITKTPQRWHLSVAGEARVFGHDRQRLAGSDEENIERPFRIRAGNKSALRPAEVERSERLMNEHRPALGSDEPGDGHTPAVGMQLIPALPAYHPIDGTSAIELWSTLAQPEQRRTSCGERKGA